MKWATLRMHGPMIVFGWYESEAEARAALEQAAEKLGEKIRRWWTVGFFPDHELE